MHYRCVVLSKADNINFMHIEGIILYSHKEFKLFRHTSTSQPLPVRGKLHAGHSLLVTLQGVLEDIVGLLHFRHGVLCYSINIPLLFSLLSRAGWLPLSLIWCLASCAKARFSASQRIAIFSCHFLDVSISIFAWLCLNTLP